MAKTLCISILHLPNTSTKESNFLKSFAKLSILLQMKSQAKTLALV